MKLFFFFLTLVWYSVISTSARFPTERRDTFDENGAYNGTLKILGDEIPCVYEAYTIPRLTAAKRLLGDVSPHSVAADYYKNPFVSGCAKDQYEKYTDYGRAKMSPFCNAFDCGIVRRAVTMMVEDPMIDEMCFYKETYCKTGTIILAFEGCIFASFVYDDQNDSATRLVSWLNEHEWESDIGTGMIFLYDNQKIYSNLPMPGLIDVVLSVFKKVIGFSSIS